MARQIRQDQKYLDKLLKLIPSEIIAAYMVLAGMIPANRAKWGTTVVTIILLCFVPLYLMKIQKVSRPAQIFFTTLSFIVWVYSLGGPFIFWGIHASWLGSVLLVLWTLAIPLVINPTDQAPA
jgi:hypothetical protein